METISASYVRDGDDWTVTVRLADKTLTGQAPGLIAARDRADQLVEKIAPGVEHPTVVHLLNGDAVEFTSAYLTARLTLPEQHAPTKEVVPEPVAAVEKNAPKKPTRSRARKTQTKSSPSSAARS